MEIEVTVRGPRDAPRLRPDILSVYRLAWTATPFGLANGQLRSFGVNFDRHSERRGFTLRVARQRGGRDAIGFAYGYTSEAGSWWREIVTRAMNDEPARWWFGNAFELAELAVVPGYRGAGVGAALHDSLLANLQHDTAVLSTQRDNHGATKLYRARGWKVIVDHLLFPGRPYPYSVYGLDLERRRAERLNDDHHRAPIVIVDYDPQWPRLFAAERERIATAAGGYVQSIEHVGSTAVPGLAAKPIIDIMAGVKSLDDASRCIDPLRSIGYEYVPEYEAFMPDRRYFRKGPARSRTHNLHLVVTDSDFWRRHLAFRDYLRANAAVAREYETLKRKLAGEFQDDRGAYTDGKTPLIRSVERLAGC